MARMKLALSQVSLSSVEADLLVVFVSGPEFAKQASFRELDRAFSGELVKIAKQEDFTGKKGQALTVHTFGKLAAKISVRHCQDAAFNYLCDHLRAWFPANTVTSEHS